MKATWVSIIGCQESLFERHKQTLRKEKARKRKIKKQKNILMFFQNGVDGQKAKKKWSFEREDERKTRKESRIGRKEGF